MGRFTNRCDDDPQSQWEQWVQGTVAWRPEYAAPPRRLDRQTVLDRLRALADGDDTEEDHIEADALLLAYINDDEIGQAYLSVHKWFA